MLPRKAKRDMRFYGQSSRSVISVRGLRLLDITFRLLANYALLKVRATYTSSITIKRLSPNSCTTGFSRMDTQTEVS